MLRYVFLLETLEKLSRQRREASLFGNFEFFHCFHMFSGSSIPAVDHFWRFLLPLLSHLRLDSGHFWGLPVTILQERCYEQVFSVVIPPSTRLPAFRT